MKEKAFEVLKIFENNGYIAYIVGGYVRDKILGIESNDIDIITNAKPDELNKIFNKKCSNNYGCIILPYNSYEFEITTFRKEYYKDLYKTVMLSDSIKKQCENIEEAINKKEEQINNKLEKIEKIAKYLEENKNFWEIKDDKIQFNNINKMTEYYNLVNDLLG